MKRHAKAWAKEAFMSGVLEALGGCICAYGSEESQRWHARGKRSGRAMRKAARQTFDAEWSAKGANRG